METEGASFSEQLLDASRRNNVDLLETILDTLNHDKDKIAHLINESEDPFGNTAIHLCCKYGSWEVLDKILDQEGDIEIDPQNRNGDTPLHLAVKYSEDEPEHGTFIAQNLIEVGADPRVRNNDGHRPIDLIHSTELDELADLLQGAELAADSVAVAAGSGEPFGETDEVIEEVQDDDDDEE